MSHSQHHLAAASGRILTVDWVVQDCIDAGQLSNAQIEAVVYAFMRFNKRLQNGEPAQPNQTCMH